MNGIINAFDWTVLGWTIIHFLWQGALIGLVAALILALVPSRLAGFRYLTACLALGLCVLTFMITMTQLGQQIRPLEPTAETIAAQMEAPEPNEITNSAHSAEAMTLDVAGLVAIAWIAGVLLMSTRFIIQWRTTVRLRNRRRPGDRFQLADTVRSTQGTARASREHQTARKRNHRDPDGARLDQTGGPGSCSRVHHADHRRVEAGAPP